MVELHAIRDCSYKPFKDYSMGRSIFTINFKSAIPATVCPRCPKQAAARPLTNFHPKPSGHCCIHFWHHLTLLSWSVARLATALDRLAVVADALRRGALGAVRVGQLSGANEDDLAGVRHGHDAVVV